MSHVRTVTNTSAKPISSPLMLKDPKSGQAKPCPTRQVWFTPPGYTGEGEEGGVVVPLPVQVTEEELKIWRDGSQPFRDYFTRQELVESPRVELHADERAKVVKEHETGAHYQKTLSAKAGPSKERLGPSSDAVTRVKVGGAQDALQGLQPFTNPQT